jgi:hypothetical protein
VPGEDTASAGPREKLRAPLRLAWVPVPWPVAAPLVSRKSRGCLFGQKRMLTGSAARRGGILPHLAPAVFGAILGMGPPWPLSAKAAATADIVDPPLMTQDGSQGRRPRRRLSGVVLSPIGLALWAGRPKSRGPLSCVPAHAGQTLAFNPA